LKLLAQIASYLLILASIGMALWGFLGFFEYFSGVAFLVPLQNPTFPAGTQFLHWLLISSYGITYLIGYFKRWQYTPETIVVICACLASMCFIQTFDFMTDDNRYIRYVFEIILCLCICLFLFRSVRMREHFRKSMDN